MPVILATWEAEIGRFAVHGQLRKNVFKIPSQPIAGQEELACLPKLCKGAEIG
jgi:hypothetical protein